MQNTLPNGYFRSLKHKVIIYRLEKVKSGLNRLLNATKIA